jgi:hypothetical protein
MKKKLFVAALFLWLLFGTNLGYCENGAFRSWGDGTIVAVTGIEDLVAWERIDTAALAEILKVYLAGNYVIAATGGASPRPVSSVRIGSQAGAEKVVSGTLSWIGKQYVLTVKGMDVVSGVVEVSAQLIGYSPLCISENMHGLSERFIRKAGGELIEEALVVDEPQDMLGVGKLLETRSYTDSGKRAEILTLSQTLGDDQKLALYKQYRLSGAFYAAAGNTLFGIGSLIQGDYVTGLIVAASMGGGIAIAANTGPARGGYGQAMLGVGTVFLGLGVGWVVPYFYQADMNNKLSNSLSITH